MRLVAARDRVGGRQLDVDTDRERIADRVGERPPRPHPAHGQTRPEQAVERSAARRQLDRRPIEERQHAHHGERVAVGAQQVVEQPVEQVRARERSGVVQGVGVEVDPRCQRHRRGPAVGPLQHEAARIVVGTADHRGRPRPR